MATASAPKLPLGAVLDILDRADETQAHTDNAPSQADLLQAMKSLGTGHAPAVLAAAVEAHCKALPVTRSDKTRAPFAWHRPTTMAQVERAERWQERADEVSLVGLCTPVLIGILTLGWIASSVFSEPTGSFAEKVGVSLLGGVLAAIFGMLPGVIVEGLVDAWKTGRGRYGRVMVEPKELVTFFKEPACREYLRAMRDSALPCFLGRDVENLRALQKDAQARRIKADQARLKAQVVETQGHLLGAMENLPA